MTTIVNTPGGNGTNDSGSGFLIGLVIVIILVILFFIFGLPAIRGGATPAQPGANINVTLPTGGGNTGGTGGGASGGATGGAQQ